jgi:DNA mismatch endonuclease (patch repair protein)
MVSTEKVYLRDGRAPVPVKEATSRVMSANKGRNTKPELLLRRALYQNGMKGYRLNWKKVPGRPDIAFPGRKVAIFVHGCFWHRCPLCNLATPKSNQNFWSKKFEKNVERDRAKQQQLKLMGWQVLTIWECQIKKNIINSVNSIKNHILNP